MRKYKTLAEIAAATKDRPLCVWSGPKLTVMQVAALFGNTPGRAEGETRSAYEQRVLDALNQLDAIEDAPEPNPAYLPVKRKVRVNDLEPGCVLRFCGGPAFDGLRLTIGKEYVVQTVYRNGFTIDYDDAGTTGVTRGHWSVCGALPWEFVSNPNFVHGFDKRKPVYLKDQAKYGGCWAGPLTISKALSAMHRGVLATAADGHEGGFSVADLTHDEPEPTYKVRDGVAKRGDTMWWWGCNGPEYCVVGQDTDLAEGQDKWLVNSDNVKHYPDVYTLAEPEHTVVIGPKGERIKAYAYMQPPYNGSYEDYLKAQDTPKSGDTDPTKWRKGDIIRFSPANADNDQLRRTEFRPGQEVTFVSHAPDVFRSMGGNIKFESAGKASSGWGASRFEFVRRP